MDAVQKNLRNKILSALSAQDFALLRPHLERIELPLRKLLEARGRRIDHIYFLESGLASVVVSAGSRYNLEVGMVGFEGMTGLAVVMGAANAVAETFVQSAGSGWRITTTSLRQALEKSPGLHNLLLRHGHTLVTQMAFTALANGCYHINERLARWLLMAHDRTAGNTVSLTHEFLSVMLGVRRPGVTAALGELEKRGVIKSGRGTVGIVDRAALEEAANGSYGVPEATYEKVFAAV